MSNTYNTASKTLRTEAITFAQQVGKGCKHIGLLRAEAVYFHPSYDEDYDTASAEATTTTQEALVEGGLSKTAAKNLCRNAAKVEALAIQVTSLGLSLEMFTAVPTNDAKKASNVICAENIDEVNALPLTKAGKLTKKAKHYLGLITAPVDGDGDGDGDSDGDSDGDKDPEVDPAKLLAKALIQMTNVENAINKLEGHDVAKQDALIALAQMLDRVSI